MTRRTLGLLALFVSLLAPAGAFAATRAGSGTDASGDATPANLDIVRVKASYATRGAAGADITLSAAPDPALKGGIGIGLSTMKGGRCQCSSAVVVTYEFATGKASAALASRTVDEWPAKATVKDGTISLSTRSRKMARKSWNCAIAGAFQSQADRAIDELAAPIRLKKR